MVIIGGERDGKWLWLFLKQKTAYEMRIRDWSSDVCSSDLPARRDLRRAEAGGARLQRDPRREDAPDHRGPLPLADRLPVRRQRDAVSPSRSSAERRVGKECFGTCRSRWLRHHPQTNQQSTTKPQHMNKHIN